LLIEELFYPKNVAIYEAKLKISFFIEGFLRQGFDIENLYLVSSTEENIQGIKCLKKIDDIPSDSLDLVILSVKRDYLIEKLQELLEKKKVKFIHIFTAGTGESDEIGIKIEKRIKNILDNYQNTRAIGPNCMGLYSPNGKVAYYASFPTESGNIGLIFQSGDLHSKMIKFGSRRYKLTFSKGLSIGNSIDIQVSEILKYYNNDEQTDLICVYFEGFSPFHKNEGKKLFTVLRNMSKPVLFMRGGKTKRGQTAVLTHTGSVSTESKIWDAIYKQTPVIEISPSLDELVDYTYLFYNYINRFKRLNKEIKYPISKRTLVILWSGGFGILATDNLTELGLELPQFKGKALEKLEKIYPAIIGSLTNPLDLPWIIHRDEFFELSKAAIDYNIDFVIIETDAWRDLENERFQAYYNNLVKIKEYVEASNKVFIIILHQYPSKSRELFNEMLLNDNFIVYPNIDIAAKSYLKLYEYGQKIKKFKIH
jgi:acyl-CoA synthetase (NDP forming)